MALDRTLCWCVSPYICILSYLYWFRHTLYLFFVYVIILVKYLFLTSCHVFHTSIRLLCACLCVCVCVRVCVAFRDAWLVLLSKIVTVNCLGNQTKICPIQNRQIILKLQLLVHTFFTQLFSSFLTSFFLFYFFLSFLFYPSLCGFTKPNLPITYEGHLHSWTLFHSLFVHNGILYLFWWRCA